MLAMLTMTIVGASCDYDNMYPTRRHNGWCAGSDTPYNGSGWYLYCQTDNRNFTWGVEGGTSAQRSYVSSLIESRFEPTDLSVSRQNPVVHRGSAETDVVVYFRSNGLPPTAGGLTWCNNAVTSRKCDQHHVWLRPSRVGSVKGTTCHEVGHSVGLTHGQDAEPIVDEEHPSQGCMKSPSGSTTTLGSHNVRMINATY